MDKPGCLRQTGLQLGKDRIAVVTARHGFQSFRLVDHHEPLVFINHGKWLTHAPLHVAGIHLKTLQHVGENGQTLATAGRIISTMAAYLATRRLTPPELGHAKGMPTLPVGILQQFGRTAVACTCRRHLPWRIGKDGEQAARLSQGIEHHIMFEKPPLQAVRLLLAQPFHPLNLLIHGTKGRRSLFLPFLHTRLQSSPFGFHILAFGHQLCLFVGHEGRTAGTPGITPLLGLTHHLPEPLQFFLSFTPDMLRPETRLSVIVAGGECCNGGVQGGYLCLMPFEITVGLHGIKHGGHKIGVVVTACQQARIGSHKATPALAGFHHKHAEHLAMGQFVVPLIMFLHIGLHLLSRHAAQRMWLIMKRTGEPVRRRACGLQRVQAGVFGHHRHGMWVGVNIFGHKKTWRETERERLCTPAKPLSYLSGSNKHENRPDVWSSCPWNKIISACHNHNEKLRRAAPRCESAGCTWPYGRCGS